MKRRVHSFPLGQQVVALQFSSFMAGALVVVAWHAYGRSVVHTLYAVGILVFALALLYMGHGNFHKYLEGKCGEQ